MVRSNRQFLDRILISVEQKKENDGRTHAERQDKWRQNRLREHLHNDTQCLYGG